MTRVLRRSLAGIALVLVAEGCGPALTELETKAPKKAAVAVTDEEMRQRYAELLTSPQIEKATEELSAVASRGMVEGLSQEQVAQQMKPLVTELTRAIVSALAASTKQLEAPVRDVAKTMTTAVLEQARQDVPRTLAPALAETLRDPEVQAALGGTTHEVTHEAVKGTEQAAQALLPTTAWLAILGAIILFFLVPISWLLKERAATKRLLADLERPPPREGGAPLGPPVRA